MMVNVHFQDLLDLEVVFGSAFRGRGRLVD